MCVECFQKILESETVKCPFCRYTQPEADSGTDGVFETDDDETEDETDYQPLPVPTVLSVAAQAALAAIQPEPVPAPQPAPLFPEPPVEVEVRQLKRRRVQVDEEWVPSTNTPNQLRGTRITRRTTYIYEDEDSDDEIDILN
jgi:hypothetical protein